MLINRILLIAVVAGVLAGLSVSVVHLSWTAPLIQAAESYEGEPSAAAATHDHALGDHHHGEAVAGGSEAAQVGHHDESAWMPADGFERAFWTVVSDVIFGVGVGLVMTVVFALVGTVNLMTGVLWGAGAFLAVSFAPSFGLPPELPGMPAADLTARQLWWVGCVAATGASLGLLAYAKQVWMRFAALALLLAPHIIGAPQPVSHETAVPAALIAEFTVAALVASAVFWTAIGAGTGWFAQRWLQTGDAPAAATAG